MQPSTLLPELERPEDLEPRRNAALPRCLLIAPGSLLLAVIASTIAILLSADDWTPGASLIPASARGLINTVALVLWANWIGLRIQARNSRRLDEIEGKIDARLRKSCCAEAFVDGFTRQPFREGGYQHAD